MTDRLKLLILADARSQLDKAGRAVSNDKHVEAVDIVQGVLIALGTFKGLSSLPPAIQDAQDAPGETIWG